MPLGAHWWRSDLRAGQEEGQASPGHQAGGMKLWKPELDVGL